jgi:hypothetical protein
MLDDPYGTIRQQRDSAKGGTPGRLAKVSARRWIMTLFRAASWSKPAVPPLARGMIVPDPK